MFAISKSKCVVQMQILKVLPHTTEENENKADYDGATVYREGRVIVGK